MKLGIDFGTTRIVVAAADRGNFPVVSFEAPDGETRDWFPSLVATSADGLRFGFEAEASAGVPGWTVLRSLKRLLEDAGPRTEVATGSGTAPLFELLTGIAEALRKSLLESAALPASFDDRFEVMLGVPANSNSNQRYMTVEAFRRAGFEVVGLLNEPSAAAIEYAHATQSRRKAGESELLLVYDLGGGTFDASLVELGAAVHDVVGTEGISTLGGDDFDHVLLEMTGHAESFEMLELCRGAKESLNPNSRRVMVEDVAVQVADYYERCRPLVESTVESVEALLRTCGGRTPDSLYVTGGGSELPLVARVLREHFGKRVKRSVYARAATAIGLAIQSDGTAGVAFEDRLGRHFGVWREADAGARVVFDAVFAKGESLPVTRKRRYRPAHNIGHFRYLEASAIDEAGRPSGDVTFWDEIRFPFDPALEDADGPVVAMDLDTEIVERWSARADGGIEVGIVNLQSGVERIFPLGRWAVKDTVKAGRRRTKRTTAG